MNKIKFLLIPLSVVTLILISLGSFVRGTGAGLACPDWPYCYGELIPDFSLNEGIYQEVGHRFIAAIVMFFTSLVFYLGFKFRKEYENFFRATVMLLLIVFVQAIFGGLTVTQKLNPYIVTSHLALGTIFFQFLLLLTIDSIRSLKNLEDTRVIERPLLAPTGFLSVFTGLVFLQMLLGVFVGASGASLACDGVFLCGGGLLPENWIGAHLVQTLHRYTGFLLLGFAIALFLRAKKGKRLGTALGKKFGHIIGILSMMVLQILVGIGNLHMKIAVGMTVFHLVLAQAILIALLILVFDLKGGSKFFLKSSTAR
jgi:cytochrome c oxidase assembly protein subunit 15